MTWADHDAARGWDDLRAAVLAVLGRRQQPAGVPAWVLLSEAAVGGSPGGKYDDSDRAASSEESESERSRLIALVELARGGDA